MFQKSFFKRTILENRNLGLWVGLALLLGLAKILTPSMYSYSSIISMLQNNAVYGILAIAEMVVILTGGIDISIGSTLSLVGIVCCRLMTVFPEVPAVFWLLLSLILGVLCGAINGILVGYFKMVPLIATLGTMYIYRALSFIVSEGKWWFPHQFTQSYQNFATFRVGGIPTILFVLGIVYIIAIIFLGYTSNGRRIYAIGTSKESSRIAGIKEARVTLLAMTLCGMLAGLSGMLYTANYATGSFGIGEGYEMTAIAICILGGVSIRGGKGSVSGVFFSFFNDVDYYVLY